jgi:hypothetical protein
VDLKHILCQIYSNYRILHLAVLSASWLSTPQSWHISMPSGEGGNHPIYASLLRQITDGAFKEGEHAA